MCSLPVLARREDAMWSVYCHCEQLERHSSFNGKTTGGRVQPVLMRHTPQLSVKTRGGGGGGGGGRVWGGSGRGSGGSGRESGGGSGWGSGGGSYQGSGGGPAGGRGGV